MSAVPPARARLDVLAREWNVIVDEVRETDTSLIAFGRRDSEGVVMKVVRVPGDEWYSGEMLAAFGGERYARVVAHAPGAALLERLDPGSDLTELVRDGRDDEATKAIASIVAQVPGGSAPATAVHAERWLTSFERYSSTRDGQIASDLVAAGFASYARLCESQTTRRLLHGDLQHYNVLASARGWVAIDPKGIVAEPAFEAGAFLRNPPDRLDLMRGEASVRHRAECFARGLELDARRVLEWAFAQAVLSLIWSREDGHPIDDRSPALVLARTLLPIFA